MEAKLTSFTIAEYCDQMEAKKIVVNRDYQRSASVWPPAARSYLIETILLNYPIPKISLFQKTDLKSRTTIKEIVDGQQRSQAILDFFNDELRITSKKGPFAGKRFSSLEDPEKKRFVDYTLSVDLFVNASDADIRQMFRRMNSYTVPLNPEEHRHATHQGDFKWFILNTTELYASPLKAMGVYSEKALSRMQDAKLFTEILLALDEGIVTYSKPKLDAIYVKYDADFPNEADAKRRIEGAMNVIVDLREVHDSALMKPFLFLPLFLAVTHRQQPVEVLRAVFDPSPAGLAPRQAVVANLAALGESLETEKPADFGDFVKASKEATNTKANRETLFRFFCRALGGEFVR